MRSLIRQLPGWRSGWAGKLAWLYLLAVLFLALLGPLVANEKPYRCTLDGETYYPLFTGRTEATLSARHPQHAPIDWQTTPFTSVWRPPVPYSYHTIDLRAGTYQPPGAKSGAEGGAPHLLGTDSLGRDVMAGMIRGCRVSLLIGLGSMLLALLIGVPLGAAGAYAGNSGWRLGWISLIVASIAVGMIVILLCSPLRAFWKTVFIGLSGLAAAIVIAFQRPAYRSGIAIPTDRLVMGVISVLDGFPSLFIILIVLAVLPAKGWLAITFVIALLRWPVMARYMRAEVLKMKTANYIQSAQLLNLPERYILWRHIVPYALRPVLVSFIFGVASAIVAESSLSFLGIGLSAEELNWGRLLAQSRNHFDAWWLVVFPGAAISLTLIALYVIAESWEKRMELRTKN